MSNTDSPLQNFLSACRHLPASIVERGSKLIQRLTADEVPALAQSLQAMDAEFGTLSDKEESAIRALEMCMTEWEHKFQALERHDEEQSARANEITNAEQLLDESSPAS